MKKTDDLFQLIKSLSKSEKGYFKKFSYLYTIEGEKNYLKLFDAIEKQQEYDEKKLLKLFQKEDFIKQFPRAKNYLYRLILKCLRLYHSERTIELELKELLEYIEILYHKQLYELYWKELKRAKKLAQENENFLSSLEIISWENKVLQEEHDMEGLKKLSDSASVDEQQIMKQYLNYREYEWIYLESFLKYYQKGSIRHEEEMLNYKSLMRKAVMKNEQRALSTKAKIEFFQINAFYCFINANYIEAQQYIEQVIQLMEKSSFFKDNPKKHLQYLHNLSLLYLSIKKYYKLPLLIHKMKDIAVSFERIKLMAFSCHSNIELLYLGFTGSFQEGIEYSRKLETEISKYKTKIDQKFLIQLYSQLAYLYMGAKRYSEALKWINKVINDQYERINSQLYSEAKIFNLIIHYEMKNMDLLEYIVRSTYRFLYQRKRLYQFENCIMNFIRNWNKLGNSEQEKTNAFKKLKENLIKISQNPHEKRALEYFDYISWLESKIEKRDFAEIVKEKAQLFLSSKVIE